MKLDVGEFEIKDKDLAARIGRLGTPHGIIETPVLFPVIDPLRQEVSLDEIREIGFNAIITNAYLLWRRRREEALSKGIHQLLSFDGIIMTDSGAYQILRYGSVEIDAIEVVEFQKSIGSDIAVILDEPTGNVKDRRQAEESVRITLERARQSLQYIDDKRIWVLPVQGGSFLDLVEYSARESSKLAEKYGMYALGSPTVHLERYEYAILLDMIYHAKRHLPLTKPLHLFGAGHPMIIPFAVALGVDAFDSASYILYARDNRYLTLSRTYRLEDLDYFPCNCPICRKYNPRDLLEMPRLERVRLLAIHNLHVLHQAILEVKVAIREGRLWELLEERSRAHPSLYTAFKKFRKYSNWLTNLAPVVKGGEVHGIFLFNEEGLWRPEVLSHHKRLINNYKPRGRKLLLVPGDLREKPFKAPEEVYGGINGERHIVFYTPFLGAIPEELVETYPLSQFEISLPVSSEVIAETARRVHEYIYKNKENYKEIIIVIDQAIEYSNQLAKEIASLLDKTGLSYKLMIIKGGSIKETRE